MEQEYIIEKITKINECESTTLMKLSKLVYPFLTSLCTLGLASNGFEPLCILMLGSTILMQQEHDNNLRNNYILKGDIIIQAYEDIFEEIEKIDNNLYMSLYMFYRQERNMFSLELLFNSLSLAILEVLLIISDNNLSVFGALTGALLSRFMYNLNMLLAARSVVRNICISKSLTDTKLKREK